MADHVFQSVLNPAGAPSLAIYRLWLLMVWVTGSIFLLVMGFVFTALARGRRRSRLDGIAASSPRALRRSVTAAVGATVLILFGLLVASVWTGRTTASIPASSAVTIAITGHQWWWEVEYDTGLPADRVSTANEFHIPIGRPVVLKVTSRDVIHSFWLPNLQGKRDLIPGYTTAIWMQAAESGMFRGQCAEFCGLQHAHMALQVIAEPEAQYERWLTGMRQPARAPQSDAERRGHDIFMTSRCAVCHTVQGTHAHGQVAPDLMHIASRHTLGAGTLPNTRAHLEDWVRDPQATKPGNQMPPNPLNPVDLQALLSYLESLQ